MQRKDLRTIKLWQDMGIVIFFHILLVVLIFSGLLPAFRAVLSLLCVLFTPGYVTLALFFPAAGEIDKATRFGLSPMVSVSILIPAGLILNYSPWGLRLDIILLVVSAFVLCFGAASLWRRSRIPVERQFSLPEVESWNGLLKNVALPAIVLFLVAAAWGYFESIKTDGDGGAFTDFYLLGSEGKAGQYPSQAVAGAPISVIVGIVNHEQKAVTYHVVLMEADGRLQRIASVTLENRQTWEQQCTFNLSVPGEKVPLLFLLYREGEDRPYRSLQLWISVLEEQNSAD